MEDTTLSQSERIAFPMKYGSPLSAVRIKTNVPGLKVEHSSTSDVDSIRTAGPLRFVCVFDFGFAFGFGFAICPLKSWRLLFFVAVDVIVASMFSRLFRFGRDVFCVFVGIALLANREGLCSTVELFSWMAATCCFNVLIS